MGAGGGEDFDLPTHLSLGAPEDVVDKHEMFALRAAAYALARLQVFLDLPCQLSIVKTRASKSRLVRTYSVIAACAAVTLASCQQTLIRWHRKHFDTVPSHAAPPHSRLNGCHACEGAENATDGCSAHNLDV